VITFWIFAGLMMAVALFFVMPPLLHRGELRHPAAERLAHVTIFNQQLEELEADLARGVLSPEDHEQGRIELEQRLLEETGAVATVRAVPTLRGWRRILLPAALIIGLPAIVVGLYYQVGNPQSLTLDAPLAAGTPHQVDQTQVQLMASRLAARLQRNPEDGDGWAMLAKSYGMMQRYNDSALAFGKAAALSPANPQLLADYADALAMAQGGRFEGKPAETIDRALRIDPNHPKALALAGSAAFEAKSYAAAVDIWQRLLAHLPENSPFADSIRNSIADARQRGGLVIAADAAAPAAHGKPSAVKGVVRLIAELKDKAAPGDTVYVYATAPAGGPQMPLAVLTRKVKDLPLTFALDDSMAMAPQMKMSNFKQVVLGVLVSKSGAAKKQSGDLVSAPTPVNVGASDVDLVIRGVVR
jgi:cytochrome c-type biogenesis protein CcmH